MAEPVWCWSVLINGWEKWEPTDDLKKGKDLLRTNWKINKKNKGGGENDDDEGWDNKSGYHSDKYDDVGLVDNFELDNDNLKRVTGLTKLVGEEESISEESDDDGVHENVEAIAAGNKGGDMVSKSKDGVAERRKSARRRWM